MDCLSRCCSPLLHHPHGKLFCLCCALLRRELLRLLDDPPLGLAEKAVIAALIPPAVFLPVQPSRSHKTVEDIQGKTQLKVWRAALWKLGKKYLSTPLLSSIPSGGRESAHTSKQRCSLLRARAGPTSSLSWVSTTLCMGAGSPPSRESCGAGSRQGMTLLALYPCCKT